MAPLATLPISAKGLSIASATLFDHVIHRCEERVDPTIFHIPTPAVRQPLDTVLESLECGDPNNPTKVVCRDSIHANLGGVGVCSQPGRELHEVHEIIAGVAKKVN